MVSAAIEPKTACIGWHSISVALMAKNLTIHPAFIPLITSKVEGKATSVWINLGLQKYSQYIEVVNEFVGKDFNLFATNHLFT